jgi:hypothetical protein
MGNLKGPIHVDGHLSADTMTVPAASVRDAQIAGDAGIARSKLAQDTLARSQIPLTSCRVWNAMQTPLPNPSANDDLGMYGGAFATDSPMIKTYDVKAAGALSFKLRVVVPLPAEYDDGETVQLRIHAEMQTTIADISCTIDVQAFESNRAQGISADLCATDAQNMNSTDDQDYDFTITATDLVAGDLLDVVITIAVNDAATVTAVVAAIGSIERLCDIRG